MSSERPDTRTRILEASRKLLESQRGRGVRMSDIAKRAGISRQALYLHFKTRAELLVATTRYVDEIKNVDQRLHASRTAESGVERLRAFIEAWGNYIPEIYGMARALLAMKDTDSEAATAWDDRMQAVRHGCAAAVDALVDDGRLNPELGRDEAIDILWTLLSVRNWEQLRFECKWSQSKYVAASQSIAERILIGGEAGRTG